MVQVIPQLGDISGRIGKGFAKGLSEQLPQEINRNRLASGLKKLGENKENLTPFQQAAAISALPGGSELIPSLIPFLQQQQQNKAYIEKSRGVRGQQQPGLANQTQAQPQQQQMQQGISLPAQPAERLPPVSKEEGKGGLASPGEITRYKETLLKEPSNQDIASLASDYLSQGITLDKNEAIKLAGQELSQNLHAQNKRSDDFKKDLSARFALDLQKGGLGNFADVPGEIQKELLDQGEYLVNAKGMSPEAAAQKMSAIFTELGKTANATKESGSFMNMFNPSSKKTRELRQQKKEFEKYGFGEQFNNMASASLGITRLQAAHVLDPIKNEKINQEIRNLKKGASPGVNTDAKTLDKIASSITPKDNLLAIAHQMRGKFRNVNQFLRRVGELADEGVIALTDRQKRELKSPEDNSFLGDILYETF